MTSKWFFCLAAAMCAALLCFPGTGTAAGLLDGLFGGDPKPFECAFEEDHNPPLDENSEAHKLYLQARDLENSKPVLSKDEQANISLMYIQAMEQGHWKAKAQMVARYLDGVGVRRSSARATQAAYELMQQGVPIGYFNFGLFKTKGWGTGQDGKEGMQLIHKAAALGSKDAQYMLGEYYIYKRFNDVLGLKYHVCAMRQGHAVSAEAISAYLEIVEKNNPMYVEYLLRAGGMGSVVSLAMVIQVFSAESPNTNKGYPANPRIATFVQDRCDQLDSNPKLRFPHISKEIQLPEHPIQGNGRQLPSKLKEACGGMWPDEAYPDLKEW